MDFSTHAFQMRGSGGGVRLEFILPDNKTYEDNK